ncbi:MAG: hypothetical protein KC731_35605 [Myxococcales bacterium]|nr:hypothetical protein [Myxococcales bacterium]
MSRWADQAIWLAAFGYFATYVPYSALTKALTGGHLSAPGDVPLTGLGLLPVTAIATTVTMFVVISLLGWWKHASRSRIAGIDLPTPTRWTFLSGLSTALIIGTTTLAYTFEGVSIVLAMVLMRGGVLVIAPIVDRISKRKVRWFSWAGLACAFAALLVSLADSHSYVIPWLCAADIAVYLASYFVRLRFMSHLAKSDDPSVNKGFLVEEQIVSGPALVALLALAALLGGAATEPLRIGFTDYWLRSELPHMLLIGAFSYGTGIFGALIFLDKRENTFCVPVNRSSSILAGVVASFTLVAWLGSRPPSATQLVSAAIIIGAVAFLTIPPMLEKRRARA